MTELRPTTSEDIPLLLSWIQSEAELVMWSGIGFRWPLTEEQLAGHPHQSDIWRSWIAAPGLGHIALKVDPKHRSGRISQVVVAPDGRGQGIGHAMMSYVMAVAFEELNLHRVSLGVYTQNQVAIGLYERLGFLREGLLRDVSRVDDQWWSVVEMGMLDDEWNQRSRG